MSRNLVICCDGTNNQFGPENTSVVRLVQVLQRDTALQRLYYDPGVGTLPEPGWLTKIGKKLSELLGLAFGFGLIGKVAGAYSYLMDTWEPGDQVFLFGFSRGAYTVRVLAGLLHALGLLPRGNHNLVPYVMRLFKAVRKERTHEETTGAHGYWRLCSEFRWTFARPVEGHDRRFPVHFMGLWDTVSSVGWVWDPISYQYTRHNPSVHIVRHAVSIDERRAFFRQNSMMEPQGQQDWQEIWFPGAHADVGGGYTANEGGLWRNPFYWILDEAVQAGLLVDPHRKDDVLQHPPPSPNPWLDQQHESLHGLWWLAELFPKFPRRTTGSWLPRLNLARRRFLENGALIHQSALRRIREMPGYAPPNFSERFLAKVRALSEVPDTLPFEW